MTLPDTDLQFRASVADFRQARRRAALEAVMARLTGKSAQLLPFEEVRKILKGETGKKRGLREIPLDAIVGSVGRYQDFTRTFLPRYDSNEDRWTRLDALIDQRGMDPIEVYQIGEAFFVLDGNHRVSIARSRGYTTIQANVTEIQTRVPLSPEDQPDDIILKAELAEFLEFTHLDKSHPEADLHVTAPGSYRFLLRQIAEIQRTKVPPALSGEKAARIWYTKRYTPVVRIIRNRGLLKDFPGRSETDLYVWISKRRAEIEQEIGWGIPIEKTAQVLVAKSSPAPRHVAARIKEKLSEVLTPEPFDPGPSPGQWRRDMLAIHDESRLFSDILVPISGEESGWIALEQALAFARPEKDHIHGLHVVPTTAEAGSPRSLEIKAKFEARCQEEEIPGEMVIEVGKVAHKICSYACWVDIVILNLKHPPGSRVLSRLASGMHSIIHRSCRPILAVPQLTPDINRLLLAYDGSPKAREALFIAAYFVGKWTQKKLDVLTVAENEANEKAARAMLSAKNYLNKRGVPANFITRSGDVAENIYLTAERMETDMIIMGGYGFSPALEVVLGSAVDQVLREARKPVLLCR